MAKDKSYLAGAVVIFLILPLISGCSFRSAFGLPSVREEGLFLKQEIDSSMRLAVIVIQENYRFKVPPQNFGNDIAIAIARQANEILSTESVGLEHDKMSNWYNELKRAEKEYSDSKTAAISGTRHAEYFKRQGYDLYVEVIQKPKKVFQESSNRQGLYFTYLRFQPFYRVYKVYQTGEVLPLMRSGPKETIECEIIDGGKFIRESDFHLYATISNRAACAKKVALDFKKVLSERLNRATE